MLVHSTGLGKTVLTSVFAGLEVNNEKPDHPLVMKIEALEPVHWYITYDLSGEDVRRALKLVLKPAILAKAFKLLFQKSAVAASTGPEGHKGNV